MSDYTREDLNKAVKEINDAIAKAETIAEAIGEGFSISPAYGMGGRYSPKAELYISYNDFLKKIEDGSISKQYDDDDVRGILEEFNNYDESERHEYVYDMDYGKVKKDSYLEDGEDYGWQASSQSC